MSIEIKSCNSPEISIIIPARNEEKFLPACLASIAKAADKASIAIEVIVVLNRCNDQTEDIARRAGCHIAYNDNKNLSQIRNSGVKIARSEIIVTLDADSRMSENMLTAVLAKLSKNNIIGGGVLIIPERISLGIFLTSLGLIPLIFKDKISAGLFYFRKSDFDAIGGFDESFVSVEDIDFARRLRAYGKKTGRKFKMIWKAYILTSCRKFDHFGDWYFLRNPKLFISILRGKDQKAANIYWYDIKR